MENGIDFLQSFPSEISLSIFKYLDDLPDIIRASSVSQLWRNFVIANGLCEQLCKKIFPQLAHITNVIELQEHVSKKSVGTGSSIFSSTEWEAVVQTHKAYAFLCQAITTFKPHNCIDEAVSASSTDNREESIENTLYPSDMFMEQEISYWSSTGQSDPQVPETLIYKLTSNPCAITQINIQPFEAFFQPGMPIYAPKSVRFRVGYPKSPHEMEKEHLPFESPADDKFIWTFSTDEFPVAHNNEIQSFKFAEPFVCVGGYLLIELLGRVQRQEADDLLYICIAFVEIIGRRLTPAFEAELIGPTLPGKFLLKYSADKFEYTNNDDT